MPGKGFFTQGLSVLLNEAVSISKIEKILKKEFKIVKTVEEHKEWAFGGPSLVIAYRPEVNGYIAVDIVDKPWPDSMGDPQEENVIFGAWAMGQFGPFTYPGSLQRAAEQAWNYDGVEKISAHKAFIRIRSSYLFGSTEENAPIVPKDYDAILELIFISMISKQLLDLPEALCFFNPNGECLASGEMVGSLLDRCEQVGLPPLELWSNIRVFGMQEEDWMLMDTVGMPQLDVIDYEAVFEKNSYAPNEIADFLRNISVHILKNGPVINDGETVKGPGGVEWQANFVNEGVAIPPRQVLRWFPVDGRALPASLEKTDDSEQEVQ